MMSRTQIIARWLCVFLVLMLLSISVVACGANSSPSSPGGNPGTQQGGGY